MCDNVLCSNCLVSRSLTEVESVSLTRFVTESPVLLLSCIDGCLGHHQPTRLLLTSYWRNNINNTSHRHHRTVCQSCLSPPLPSPLPVLKWVKMFSFNNFGTWKFSFIERVRIVLLSLIDLYNLICHTKGALYWIKLVNYFFNSPCGTFALASKMVSYNVLIIELATEGKNSIPKL